jgi:hypothetical protein
VAWLAADTALVTGLCVAAEVGATWFGEFLAPALAPRRLCRDAARTTALRGPGGSRGTRALMQFTSFPDGAVAPTPHVDDQASARWSAVKRPGAAAVSPAPR